MPTSSWTRRGRLSSHAAGGSAGLLAGCDQLGQSPTIEHLFASGEWLSYRVQRLIGGAALARE
jgi:hypothetical protein